MGCSVECVSVEMGHEKPLKLHLVKVDPQNGRGVFYPEPPTDDEAETTQHHRGVRGWAESTFRRFREKWQHSHGKAAETTRRVWAWLHKRTHPDEPLLARLRSAGSIELTYPTSLTGTAVARSSWCELLARSRRRHAFWLVANSLVAPLSIVLAPLPGPNILGYWFVYRAIHHWLILVGLRRVRNGRIPTRFLATGDAGTVTDFLRRHVVLPSREAGDPLFPGGNPRN